MGSSMMAINAVFEPQSQAPFNRSTVFGASVIKPDMAKAQKISALAQRIQDRLDALGMSARHASELAGLSPDAIRNILRKPDSLPRGRTLVNLAKTLGVTPQYLLTGGESLPSSEGFGVRYGGIVEAGAFRPHDGLNQDFETRLIPIAPDSRYPADQQFAFRVAGDSMTEAKIFEGMYVLAIDVNAWERFHGPPNDGRLVIVARTRNGDPERELTVKRLRIFRDRMELQPESSNPQHKPFVFPWPPAPSEASNVEVIAVVLTAVWLYA